MSERLILIFQKPSLSELAPSLKGGCRGFKGPVPQPLWIRTSYSVVERNYMATETFVKIFVPEDATRTRLVRAMQSRTSLDGSLVIACFRRERRSIRPYSMLAPFSMRSIRNIDRWQCASSSQ